MKVDLKKYHVYQEDNSLDCGPACLEIIYKSKRIDKSLKAIAEELGYDTGGTYAPEIAKYLCDSGIENKMYLANNALLTVEESKELNKEEKINHLEAWFAHNMNHLFSNFVVFLMIYLRHGGELEVKTDFNAENIESGLDENNKWLVGVHRSMMWGQNVSTKTMEWSSTKGKPNEYHFVLINDYDDENFEVVDPYPTKKEEHMGGNYKIKKEILINGAMFNMGVFTEICYKKT